MDISTYTKATSCLKYMEYYDKVLKQIDARLSHNSFFYIKVPYEDDLLINGDLRDKIIALLKDEYTRYLNEAEAELASL